MFISSIYHLYYHLIQQKPLEHFFFQQSLVTIHCFTVPLPLSSLWLSGAIPQPFYVTCHWHLFFILKYLLIDLECKYICVVVCLLLHAFGGQRTLVGVGPSTIQVLEIELWSSSMVTNTFTPKASSPAQHQHCWRHSNLLFPWKGFLWDFDLVFPNNNMQNTTEKMHPSFLHCHLWKTPWSPSLTGDIDFDPGHFSQSTIWFLYSTVTTSPLDRWRDLKTSYIYSSSLEHPPRFDLNLWFIWPDPSSDGYKIKNLQAQYPPPPHPAGSAHQSTMGKTLPLLPLSSLCVDLFSRTWILMFFCVYN